MHFVYCMNQKSGSFVVDSRLQRHFSTFACAMPSSADILTIYSSLLTQHLDSQGKPFSNDVVRIVPDLLNATLDIHNSVMEVFLPSAVKFHYNFNLRELTNLVQGLCLTSPDYYAKASHLLDIWKHECHRVYADRLMTTTEVGRFADMLHGIFKKQFPSSEFETDFPASELEMEEELAQGDGDAGGRSSSDASRSNPVFTSFCKLTVDDEPVYLPVKGGLPSLKKVLNEKLSEYNESKPIMDLVLFTQAALHVVRICRILFNPRGNALLVGVGGSGKQSLAKLATFICGYDMVLVSLNSTFGIFDLQEILKELYRRSGMKGERVAFLMTDQQILHEKFLVYINDLLSTGDIPDLFNKDEIDGIFGRLRSEAKSLGIPPDSRDRMMEFFLGRVKANLHIILCFSPIGTAFRLRARRFPALINCCQIDWFHPWPKDALVSVANAYLQDTNLGTPEVQENVCYHMAEVHLSVTHVSEEFKKVCRRYNNVTPKSFLELIAFYKKFMHSKQQEVGGLIGRLDNGLTTLKKTAKDVEVLQDDLKQTLVRVEEKRRAADEVLEQMGQQRVEAEAQAAIASTQKVAAKSAADTASKIKVEAKNDLDEAQPAMERARDAVNCLSKASLAELKNMSKPPPGVDKVTNAVLIMIKLEKKNLTWDNAKKMMAKVDAFLQQLQSYRGEDIPDDVIQSVEPIIAEKGFNFEAMEKKSQAAANLCNWVVNIVTYNKIYKRVKPLMDRLRQAEELQQKSEGELNAAMALVAEVEHKLAELQKTFMKATEEKAVVEAQAAACLERLSLAERLVNGLSSEKDRWGIEVDKLRIRETMLVGDTLLGAAFVSYIGAFDTKFRLMLWQDTWLVDLSQREIPVTEGVDPMFILSRDAEIAEWMNQGLPSDRISIENGVIATSCARWPLFVDPQLQGVKWLKRRESLFEAARRKTALAKAAEKDELDTLLEGGEVGKPAPTTAGFVVIQMTQPHWLKKIEHAITNGNTVLIENIGETVDAFLDPIMSRAIYKKGFNFFIKLGGEEVEYDPQFKLFLQTKLSNPHYSPEVAAQCTLINFMVTESGLEDQLLADVVNQEQPELEQQKRQLQQAFNQYKIQLLDLENQLLERLANAPEDILSDVPLIEGLEATKATANEINEAVAKGEAMEIDVNEKRDVFRPVASEGSMLYFLITQMSAVDHMYQYSLDSFKSFFYKSFSKAATSDDAESRAQLLRGSLRFIIFTWVCRGLFVRHKLIFAAQLTFQLLSRGGGIGEDTGFTPEFLDFLLRGPQVSGDPVPDTLCDWLQESSWQSIVALAELPGFESFMQDLEDNSPRFNEWFKQQDPESQKLPLDWAALDKKPFIKLLVVRCLRPDRMEAAFEKFIINTLPDGSTYTSLDAQSNSFQIIEQAYTDSSPVTPIYFILSPGADVVSDVDKLAAQCGQVAGKSYHNVSLGQGQDVVAMEMLQLAKDEGHWVILNNVHLMPSWLRELEKKLDTFTSENTHPMFRLFLSSDPAKSIPFGLLERSIKLTYEAPSGLKANLKRALCSFSRDDFEEMEPRTKGILFGLCYFHALMLERRKFGSMGFNMLYPFATGDLLASSIVLSNYMENAPSKVPWQDLRYLFGEIMYGGHIVNDNDRLMANTYLAFFLNDDLNNEMSMYPYTDQGEKEMFLAPKVSSTYDKFIEYVDTKMSSDSPLAFGFHPNAEIGYRTQRSKVMFSVIMELQPRQSGQNRPVNEQQQIAETTLADILDDYRDFNFNIEEIKSSVEEMGPFQNVFIQECERLNLLVDEIVRSMVELDMGFRGDLTMSDAMEALSESLYMNEIPAPWAKLASPSLRSLSSWKNGILKKQKEQLEQWIGNPMEVPRTTWISGLFNPQSFLTAIMQVTSQKNSLELDKIVIVTDVTKWTPEADFAPSRDGAHVHGLVLEGASWGASSRTIEVSTPRELCCEMPVITCRGVVADRSEQANMFSCPVYKTQKRGPQYVFSAKLKTKAPPQKWVLAGVALLMDFL